MSSNLITYNAEWSMTPSTLPLQLTVSPLTIGAMRLQVYVVYIYTNFIVAQMAALYRPPISTNTWKIGPGDFQFKH